MAFCLFAVFVTVLLCLNFEEVKSLECSTYCGVKCHDVYNGHGEEEDRAHCVAANLGCDCTTFDKILGLVLGVTTFVVIVGTVGCYCIYRQVKQLNMGAGGAGMAVGGAVYQPSPSRMNYAYGSNRQLGMDQQSQFVAV